MTSSTQIQMLMRELLFVNYRVEPEALGKLLPRRLRVDTRTDSDGREIGFVSAVCFRVAEVSSNVLPLPRLTFEQVNYRAYVRMAEAPAVYFFDMKVNSKAVTALSSFLRAPVGFEDIMLTSEAAEPVGGANYTFTSAGLQVSAKIPSPPNDALLDVPPDFITHRLTGYAGADDNLFRIDVEHPILDAISVHIESARSPRLEQLGLLTADESSRPSSALYVREALFKTRPPTREP
jgi:hypothetical protein